MTEKTASPERDVYRCITDHIIAAIEAGARGWKMPWHNDVAGIRPVNANTGKPYRGVNVISLWSTAQENGYAVPQWGTYKQWAEMGAQVRKGERSSPVVFWKFRDKDDGRHRQGVPGPPEDGRAEGGAGVVSGTLFGPGRRCHPSCGRPTVRAWRRLRQRHPG